MNNIGSIQKIREIFSKGGNVIEFLREDADSRNDFESIMISYDLQAGSYIKFANENQAYIDKYTDYIIKVLQGLGSFSSIMEVGVGEATIMCPLMAKLNTGRELQKFGFDISWSRTRYASSYCDKFGITANLFMANLFSIPLPDNSIDIIYTSHSLEPNGGREKEALKELYRVASKYVVLLEPDYQNAAEAGKNRMDKNGYVKNLNKNAIELGYDVIENRPFDVFVNPLNPTGLTIIKKEHNGNNNAPNFVCPITQSTLEKVENIYFSEKSGLMYPIINNIACLLEANAVLGTQFNKFNP